MIEEVAGDIEIDLDNEELSAWLGSYTTKAVFDGIRRYANAYKASICSGSTLDLSSVEQTALQTANVVSYCKGLDMILNLNELLETEDEGEEDTDE